MGKKAKAKKDVKKPAVSSVFAVKRTMKKTAKSSKSKNRAKKCSLEAIDQVFSALQTKSKEPVEAKSDCSADPVSLLLEKQLTFKRTNPALNTRVNISDIIKQTRKTSIST